MRFIGCFGIVLGVGCAVAFSLSGCSGRADLPPTALVTGRVTLDGKSLSGGVVLFHPDRTKGNSGPTGGGETDQQGRYAIRTAGSPGALVGWHVVTVEKFNTAIEGRPSLVPRVYRRPDMSVLNKEVKAGVENVIDLELVSNP